MILYVLAVNTITEAAQVRVLLWLTVVVTGLRCLEGISRWVTMPADIKATAEVVLEHDDSFFLGITFALLLGAFLWRKWLPKYFFPFILCMIPLVFYVMIINQRRAAFLSLFLMLVSCLPLVWVTLRSKMQRKQMIYLMVLAGIVGAAYLAVFWNKTGGIASPAAAVKSVIQPDERDYLSNLYRDQENQNLRATISLSPLVGVGYGKPMLQVTAMVSLTDFWGLNSICHITTCCGCGSVWA